MRKRKKNRTISCLKLVQRYSTSQGYFSLFPSLDMQTTKGLDRQMENSRQTMFIAVFERILKNLRTKRDISEDQLKMVGTGTKIVILDFVYRIGLLKENIYLLRFSTVNRTKLIYTLYCKLYGHFVHWLALFV